MPYRNHQSSIKVIQSTGSHVFTQSVRTNQASVRYAPDPNQGHWTAQNLNEIQQIQFDGSPTGGTFTLTFSGQTTAGVAYNATAANVQSALEALAPVGAGNLAVVGAAGGPWQVEFIGALAKINHPSITGDGSSLIASVKTISVLTVQDGGGNDTEIRPDFGGYDDQLSNLLVSAESPAVGDPTAVGASTRLIVSGTVSIPEPPASGEEKNRDYWRGPGFSQKIVV